MDSAEVSDMFEESVPDEWEACVESVDWVDDRMACVESAASDASDVLAASGADMDKL